MQHENPAVNAINEVGASRGIPPMYSPTSQAEALQAIQEIAQRFGIELDDPNVLLVSAERVNDRCLVTLHNHTGENFALLEQRQLAQLIESLRTIFAEIDQAEMQ